MVFVLPKTEFHYVAHAGLEFTIFLPVLAELFLDYRCQSPCSTMMCNLNFFSFYIYFQAGGRVCVHVSVHMWGPENNLRELFFFPFKCLSSGG